MRRFAGSTTLTRYYGVFAPASPHRKNLPDRPQPKQETSAEESAASATPPQKSKLSRNSKGKRRMGWAALLKRTFEIDVLRCVRCSGRMKLVAVVMTADAIRETLVGIGVSPRPPVLPQGKTSPIVCEDTHEYVVPIPGATAPQPLERDR
jgi:hypothetical protein